MGDRYTITERVDQGGMAEVFRGVAESLQGFKKSVAIKRILPNLTKNKKFVSMFLDEARLSLHLQHANIVHVFDIGIADTAYFIVMEYVDGANLKGIIEHHRKQGRRLQVAHVLYIMLEVCKGLAYAHDAQDPENGKALGIVHRDISPPNILLSKMGEVKLVDFGLAKATSQIETTDPGVVKGKFSYLSPEAASAQEVDHRADLFAVGILLWELLTGKRLFYGETDYQTVELVRQAKIPSIQALNPEVDHELEGVVRKALTRHPQERFQTAADMQDAIAQVLFSRGMKVTSRDIATLVKDACKDRDKGTGRQSGPSKSIIDTLIQEEMLKFTSLDDEAVEVPERTLSPEKGSNGQSPLDPGSFIDTRGWADDAASGEPLFEDDPDSMGMKPRLTPPPMNVPDLPVARRSSDHKIPQLPPELARISRSMQVPSSIPELASDEMAEIDSLQQILEPDKTGPWMDGTIDQKKVTQPGGRGPMLAIILAGSLFALVVVILLVFKDKIFGH